MAQFDGRAMIEQQSVATSSRLLALSVRCVALVGAYCGVDVQAAELRLTGNTVIRFADVREGAEAVARRDDYIRQMSPIDRQIRLQTDRNVSEAEFAAFAASHVRPWQPEEIEMLTPLVSSLQKKLAAWKLTLPPVVLLVKTTGREESGAAYCRGNAIVLSQNMINGGQGTLEKVLPHEVFHILSSHNPALREALYQIIGFRACNEVLLPEGWRERKITNPDAPVNNHYITVNLAERSGAELMPVLLSKFERYDAARGGTLFSYLDFKLLLLENDGDQRRAAIVDGKPVLLEPGSVPGFLDQVGRNTTYLIHPEEILADNFVFLINGRINLATPRVVAEMGKLLQSPAERE